MSTEIRLAADAVSGPFYELYLLSMKRLGVPPHPKRFFDGLVAGLGDRITAAWVWLGDELAAVLLGVRTGLRLQIHITASSPERWNIRPNDLAHWDLIEWAWQQGMTCFDFGSARYSGQVQFKKKWGVTFHPYAYYLLGSPDSPATAAIRSPSSSSKRMQAMAGLWRRTMPLPLTPLFGAPIRRYLTK